jgi:hypothetical protein
MVATSRPVESEATLSFAGLVDLLAPFADEALPRLPDPQREVMEAVLVRTVAKTYAGGIPDGGMLVANVETALAYTPALSL